ncbi:riboflavin synthase [Anaerocolumna sedimenticola]|uniref:Riboflavin synthase n=1 Tax=Anaerocolumna sedimenticola TaxID=2696063 RepID=A0A6P1TKK4_9FIRM|nr:riboflavin synthase [Anaerocolumna sedimenticola]QHQ60963.1 riboflavin synthase [Anaerocolumna sedimenticola]
MFTGLIEEIGEIQNIIKSVKSAKLRIKAGNILEDVNSGDSISTNGVCLTVTEHSFDSFTVDVMAETMRKSNLHLLSPGDRVNLERALRAGDRMGGHIVSGHIDGMGTITKYEKEDNAVWVTINAEPEIMKYIIFKGSVSIDGVSLTVAYIDDTIFRVSIIPHTRDLTTLINKKIGDRVNIECDMIGKYIEKLLFKKEQEKKTGIDMEFLSQTGFI